LFIFRARKIWREYFPEVSAVVFLVDTSDPERFVESKTELDVRHAHITGVRRHH